MVRYDSLKLRQWHDFSAHTRSLRNRLRGPHGVWAMMGGARRVTQITGNEVGFALYASLDDLVNPEQEYRDIVVAHVGTEYSTTIPTLNNTSKKGPVNGEVYVPVFELHTHPPMNGIFPSLLDLKSSYERKVSREYQSGSGYAKFSGNVVNIIVGTGKCSSGALFYQYTKDSKAYLRSRKKDYSMRIEEAQTRFSDAYSPRARNGKTVPEFETYIQQEFARQLQRSNKLRTLFVPLAQEDIGHMPPQEIVEQFARKFSYQCSVMREQ